MKITFTRPAPVPRPPGTFHIEATQEDMWNLQLALDEFVETRYPKHPAHTLSDQVRRARLQADHG